jgi:putative transposase
MSRYRLKPTPAQEVILRQHCAHARYVWNLAVEQHSWWRPAFSSAPGYCAQAAQLTEARSEFRWLAAGSQMAAIARLKVREVDRRKDWAEKCSTDVARRFDIIRIEDLRISNMTRSARGTLDRPGRNTRQKAGLNRGILASGWGLLARRLHEKARGRVEKIDPAFTSQRCSACGHVAADSRESQALFRCTACGYAEHADVNAAKNIAAGHAVTARGRSPLGGRVNREPQPLPLSA